MQQSHSDWFDEPTVKYLSAAACPIEPWIYIIIEIHGKGFYFSREQGIIFYLKLSEP